MVKLFLFSYADQPMGFESRSNKTSGKYLTRGTMIIIIDVYVVCMQIRMEIIFEVGKTQLNYA